MGLKQPGRIDDSPATETAGQHCMRDLISSEHVATGFGGNRRPPVLVSASFPGRSSAGQHGLEKCRHRERKAT